MAFECDYILREFTQKVRVTGHVKAGYGISIYSEETGLCMCDKQCDYKAKFIGEAYWQ